MGLEQQAEKVGRSLRLRGSLAFWVGAAVLVLFGLVAYMTLTPVAQKLTARIQSGASKLQGLAGSGAAQSAADPDTEGLS